MRVLVACEESQEVCKAFRARGHEAYSCDLQECSGGYPEWHIQDDVISHLQDGWDIIIAHPPCTYQSNSGVRWLYNPDGSLNYDRWNNLEKTLDLFNAIFHSECEKIAMENPIPHKYAKEGFEQINYNSGRQYFVNGIGEYSQVIQPWQFGHGETKATCLWLKGLPKLEPTNIVEGREQRIWKMAPSEDRAKLRSKTFPGIAKAMAEQWG